MNKTTITCFLCGGVHIYPGPRFGNHLLHGHGVLYNHDYIMSLCQYKDSNSTLPPIIPSNPSSSLDQFTQTDESIASPCSRCDAQHLNVFNSISPVKKATPSLSSMPIPHGSYHYPSPFSTSTPKAASLHDSLPQVSALHAVKNQEHFSPFQQDLESVPVKSGFLFKCALCKYLTKDDTTFWKHINNKHDMHYKIYKVRYGSCETPIGSGKFMCSICQATMKHLPGYVLRHLRSKHKITWEQYIDIVRIPSDEQKVEIKTEWKENVSENTLDESQHLKVQEGEVDLKRKFIEMESSGREADNIVSSCRSHEDQFTEHSEGLPDIDTTKSYPTFPLNSITNVVQGADAKDGENPVVGAIPPPGGAVTMENKAASGRYDKKCRVKCIKDKNNKYCSQCDLNFITRILFLRHCQDVHKLRFKNKCGTPLLLTKDTLTGDVGQNQSMRSKPKSPEPSERLHSSSPSRSLAHKSPPTVSASSSPNRSIFKARARSVHACQFCHKVFSSNGNMRRHVKQSCTMRGDQEIIKVKDEPVVKEELQNMGES